MVEKEPSFGDKVIGTLWNVGGDPDGIDEAAGAFRWLADDLRLQSTILHTVATGTLETWDSGKSREVYKSRTDKLKTGYEDYANSLTDVAGQLNSVADLIRDAQRQAHNLKLMALAALAVGAGFALLSFGASAAAGAAEAAGCAAGFWAMMARLAASLLRAVAAIAKVLSLSKKVMAIGMAISAGSTVAFKALGDNKLAPWTWEAGKFQNPFNPDVWSANDVSNIILGGILAGGIFKTSQAVKGSLLINGTSGAKAVAIRLTTNSVAGASGGAAGSGVGQYWLLGKPLGDKDAGSAVKTTALLGGAFGPASRLLSYKSLGTPIALGGGITMGTGDWVRQLTGIPIGAELYNINFGEHQPPDLSLPLVLSDPPAVRP